MKKYDSIKPGQEWLDTDGKPIQAHGASMFYENGTFYWYGENKEKTIPGSGIWHWGVRCYSSKDLYNWVDEGLIVEPDTEHRDSPLYPSSYMDRPHIVYNPHTKKYVCWVKFAGVNPEDHCFTILIADHFLGPYRIVKDKLFPNGAKVGDYDLEANEESGKAYLFAETDISRVTSYTLTKDYLDVEKEDYIHFDRRFREGVTHFLRNGRHYLLTSGRTGYIPNPSEISIADDWHGPYTLLGNPHINDENEASFNSQVSCIFRHPEKKDLYIAMADRWCPDFRVTKGVSEKIWNIIVRIYKKQTIDPDEKEWFDNLPMMDGVNTSKARYVWLPIRFEGDRPCIDWLDEWKVEDYE